MKRRKTFTCPCNNCETTITWIDDADNSETPEYCAFCGHLIDEELDLQDDENDEEDF